MVGAGRAVARRPPRRDAAGAGPATAITVVVEVARRRSGIADERIEMPRTLVVRGGADSGVGPVLEDRVVAVGADAGPC